MNRRRIITAVVLGSALVAIPGPASTQTNPDNVMWAAIFNTGHAALDRMCGPQTTGVCSAASKSGALTMAKNWANANIASCGTSTPCTWMKAIKGLFWPYPVPIGAPGMAGGGATGGWTEGDDCGNLAYSFDVDGNLIVPSMGLPGSGPMKGQNRIAKVDGNVGIEYRASNVTGAALWATHSLNKTRGSDQREWLGCYAQAANGTTFYCSSQAFFRNGTKVTRRSSQPTVIASYETAQSAGECPIGAVDGGDAEFYREFNYANTECVHYFPNTTVGKQGYIYAHFATVEASQWDKWPSGNLRHPTYANCPLAKEFIRRLTEGLLKEAAKTPGYPGPTNPEVEPEDVKTGDYPPVVDDIADTGTDDPETPGTPYPEPTPTPTPTPTSSPPPYDPTVGLGDPTAPEIDWWPDLPTIEVDLGSPACPTYSLSLVGWWDTPFVLDSHCPLIEQNRAAISLLMVAMFSMMSMFIVLRA